MNNKEREPEAFSAKLPNFWLGYVIASIFLILGILEFVVVNPGGEQEISFVGKLWILFGLGDLVYWFICIYKMHKLLAQLTNSAYPIAPGVAVGGHFVPLYNFYWIFKWPGQIAKFVNEHLNRKPASEYTGGFLLLAFFVGRTLRIDGTFIALILIFSVGHYLSRKILEVIRKSNKIPLQQGTEEADESYKETKAEKEGPALADRLMGRVNKEGKN